MRGRYSVLVIDDDVQVRDFLRAALVSSGYDTRTAIDGTEGIRLFRESRPDCVLCDLFMPNKDGLEVIPELRQYDKDVPIVAISGGSVVYAEDLLPVAKRLGASAALRKPFSVKELRDCLAGVLAATPTAP